LEAPFLYAATAEGRAIAPRACSQNTAAKSDRRLRFTSFGAAHGQELPMTSSRAFRIDGAAQRQLALPPTKEKRRGAQKKGPKALAVDRGGIEPPTHGFSVHCSTN
jgi:hypothetical protein